MDTITRRRVLGLAASVLLVGACTNDYQSFSFGSGGASGASTGGGNTGGSATGGSGGKGGTGGATGGTGGATGGTGGATGGTGGATGGTGGATGGTGGATGGTGGATGGTGGATGGTGGATGGTGGATGGTGGATGGTGGATGGTGGATGGTGGVVGVEDCLNGVDDNGNGLTDCSDPQCQAGYTCVTPAPTGWIGVGWIDSQASSACPGPFLAATKLYEQNQLTAPPASCSCGCGNPGGVACSVALSCSAGASCISSASTPVGTNCSQLAVPAPNGANSCIATAPQAAGGSCQANASANITPYTWSPSARACLLAQGGVCADASKQCVAQLAGATKACIARGGDQTCPGAPYTVKTLYFNGAVTDTRACSGAGCSCGSVQGAACGCTGANCGVAVRAQNTCGGGNLSLVPANGTCTTFNDANNGDTNWGVQRVGIAVTTPGSCSSSGSANPTGSATPNGSVTVCCTP